MTTNVQKLHEIYITKLGKATSALDELQAVHILDDRWPELKAAFDKASMETDSAFEAWNAARWENSND